MMNLVRRLKFWSRYGPCWCLTVFRWGRRKVELCFTPSDYEPPEHVHPNSDGEFWVVYGKNRYIYRKTFRGSALVEEGYNIDDRKYWKLFSVRAGTPHAFRRGSSPMVWLCFERWTEGSKVTSVAKDMVLT